MRVLVVGTVPPPGGTAARALAAVAAQRTNDGDLVELLSPDARSAAHRTGRLNGLVLAARLAVLSRRFDALVLRVEDGVPCAKETNRVVRALSLLALGEATRRFQEVTIRLDSPVPIPGGVGGRATERLWASATKIVVAGEFDRDLLLVATGVDPASIVVESLSVAIDATERPWPEATEPELRTRVLEAVRSRAAADRAALAARSVLTAGSAADAPALVAERPAGAQALGIARIVGSRLWRRAVRSVRPVLG